MSNEEIEREKARKRVLATQNNNAAKENFPEQGDLNSGQSRDIVAKKVGFDMTTSDNQKLIEELELLLSIQAAAGPIPTIVRFVDMSNKGTIKPLPDGYIEQLKRDKPGMAVYFVDG